MTQAPWWGIAVIAGVFALGGVCATQVTTVLLERSRRRREVAERWHDDRKAAYAEYLIAANKCMRLLFSVEADGYDEDIFRAASYEILAKYQAVNFLATEPVRAAADEVQNTIGDKFLLTMGYDGLFKIGGSLPEEMRFAMRQFEAAVRAEFGIE